MNRIVNVMVMGMAVAAWGVTAAWGQSADLAAAKAEMAKPLADRNMELVGQKLTAVVSSPEKVSVADFLQARLLQEQIRVGGMADKTAPQKRMALNQASVGVIEEIGCHYLADDVDSAVKRFDAYRAELAVAAGITDSVRAKATEADVVKVMLADLDGRYLTPPDATPETKEPAIQAALRNAAAIKDAAKRREFTLGVYDRYVGLGTASGKAAIVDRAKVHAAAGEIDAAMKDFQLVVGDAEVGDDVKNLARVERMRVFTAQAMWKEAKADAEVLSTLSIKNVSGSILRPLIAVDVKRQAIRVLVANGSLDQTGFAAATDQLCLAVLETENLTAEEKSSVIADALLERASDLAGRFQWDSAMGWAKAAYDTAPNAKLSGAVTLIQQILANRSRKPLGKDGFNLAKEPKDVAAARAFYARQSGTKKVAAIPTTTPSQLGRAAEIVVTLSANLGNEDQFQRQLSGVSLPFSDSFKAAVQKVAAEHADPMTRALASGLLGDTDKAVDVMGGAINALGLESPKVSALVNFTARFVRAKFESVALANAFLESQVDGPAGKDGKLGTEDDKPNPLTAAGN